MKVFLINADDFFLKIVHACRSCSFTDRQLNNNWKTHCCPEVGMEGLLFTQGDFDSCPIACVVGGIVISVSKVLAEELWSRAENGEEKPW